MLILSDVCDVIQLYYEPTGGNGILKLVLNKDAIYIPYVDSLDICE